MTLLMIVELLVVLLALWVGARYGSLALGAISGIAWMRDTYFFIPNYPSDIATINFDRSGTTVIGKL